MSNALDELAEIKDEALLSQINDGLTAFAKLTSDTEKRAAKGAIIGLVAQISDPIMLDEIRESAPKKLGMAKGGYDKAVKDSRAAHEEQQNELRVKMRREQAAAASEAAAVAEAEALMSGGGEWHPAAPTSAPHNYVIENGMIQIESTIGTDEETGETETTCDPVCTFTAQIVGEVHTEFNQVIYKVAGTTIRSGNFEVEVGSDEFCTPSRLKIILETAAGALETVFPKMEAHLGPAIKLLSEKTNMQRFKRYDRTGWIGDRFAMPGRMPEGETCHLPQKLPYAVPVVDNVPAALEALTLLMQSLPDIYSPILLSAILGAPMARKADLQDRRYGVFVRGQSGTYKTTIAQSFMAIYGGGFVSDKNIIGWGDKATPNAIMRFATSAHDMPFLIDNYKSNTGSGSKGFISMIHAIMEGGEKDRLDKNREISETRDISCWPFCTGEDMPDTDPATTARLLVIHTEKRKPPAVSADRSVQRQLAQIGAIWLDWLETPAAQVAADTLSKNLSAAQDRWAEVLLTANPGMPNPYRVASTLALNQSFFMVAAQHPVFGKILQPYVAKHAEGLRLIALRMAASTTESLEATRYVSALKELLATGRCILYQNVDHFKNLPQADRGRVIGWADGKGGAYLYPDLARHAVERDAGVDLSNMTSNGIYNQLAELGFLVKGGDGKSTVSKKFGGALVRYLHLNAEALELPVAPTAGAVSEA